MLRTYRSTHQSWQRTKCPLRVKSSGTRNLLASTDARQSEPVVALGVPKANQPRRLVVLGGVIHGSLDSVAPGVSL